MVPGTVSLSEGAWHHAWPLIKLVDLERGVNDLCSRTDCRLGGSESIDYGFYDSRVRVISVMVWMVAGEAEA